MNTLRYIALLGGDKRQIILGEALAEENYQIRYVGFEKYPQARLLELGRLKNVLPQSEVIIAPLTGIDASGTVKTPYGAEELSLDFSSLALIQEGSLFITGSLPGKMRRILTGKGIFVQETAGRGDVACLNAVPTAEGALQYAMEEGEIVLQGSSSLVTGFGRCAKALASRLLGLGSVVSIAARNPVALAEAEMYGYLGVPLTRLADFIHKYDFIFNTVPAMLFPEEILEKIRPGVVIIDVASHPGGVDFAAAAKKPLTARHALGIPGKTAPVSAGIILSRVYGPMIKGHFEQLMRKGGEKNEA